MMYFHFPTFLHAFRTLFSRTYFTLRHVFFAIFLMIPFFLLRGFVWFVRMLDLLVFPGYRKQELKAPIYIIANPRSGTTFLHRLMAYDAQFTTYMLWHSIFPAVIFYKFFDGMAWLDGKLGRPLYRIVDRIQSKGFEGWDTIHKTKLEDAEEDEQLFVYAALSPILALLFPFLDELPYAKFPDRLPDKPRRKLMRYYTDCLRRHVYATGLDKTLMLKNTLIAGRMRATMEAMPDVRVVHLIRHPYEPIPSLISMFSAPWKVFCPHLKGDSDSSKQVAEMLCEFYDYFEELKKEIPEERFIEVEYKDLVNDPKGTVERIYAHFGLEMSDEYRAKLEAETSKARQYKSRHEYSLGEYGLKEEEIHQRLKHIFDAYDFKP